MPRANSFSDSILSQPNQLNWSIFPRVLAEPYKIEEVVPARQRVSRGNLPRDLALCAFFSNSSTLAGHFSRAPLAFPLPVLAFEPVEGTSNDRKRVFRAVAAASSVVEWIFLAFPLAAGVTRLRLKYLLVDFATMGTHSLFLFLFPLDTLRHRGPRKILPPGKKVLRDFSSAFTLSHSPRVSTPCLLASFHLHGFQRQLSTLLSFSFTSHFSHSSALVKSWKILVGQRQREKNRKAKEG